MESKIIRIKSKLVAGEKRLVLSFKSQSDTFWTKYGVVDDDFIKKLLTKKQFDTWKETGRENYNLSKSKQLLIDWVV